MIIMILSLGFYIANKPHDSNKYSYIVLVIYIVVVFGFYIFSTIHLHNAWFAEKNGDIEELYKNMEKLVIYKWGYVVVYIAIVIYLIFLRLDFQDFKGMKQDIDTIMEKFIVSSFKVGNKELKPFYGMIVISSVLGLVNVSVTTSSLPKLKREYEKSLIVPITN